MARKVSGSARPYVRFTLSDRVQHLVMLVSFTILGITGLVQKFPLNSVSVFIVRLSGGVEGTRFTHHLAATVLMLVTIFHLVEMGHKVFVLRRPLAMLPAFQDAKDAWTALKYNLGFGKLRPQMGRYTFEEKAEYWALVWGIAIMGLTGFMMWNPLATVKLLPGDVIPAAKAAHGAEAILAVLAIIVWHMYAVHLKRFNRSMWTGQLTEEEMLHEHPLELADIKAGMDYNVPEPGALRRRRMLYYPIAGLLATTLLIAVYGFVTGEQTAITTVPPQTGVLPIYVPQTPTAFPPTATQPASPTAAVQGVATDSTAGSLGWAKVSPMLAAKCGACHGSAIASGGLRLDSYSVIIIGGSGGAVIVPGDPESSKLFLVQSMGGHPGQLSPEELSLVRTWIEEGATE